MGDADAATQMLRRDPELETLLDDELTEIEEELRRLFTYINLLEIRTSRIKSQMAFNEKILRCFTALNLFVVPILLAIWISYMTAGTLTSGSIIEAGLDTFVMILMHLSTIGFPLFFYTLYVVYFLDEEVHDDSEMLNDLMPDTMSISEMVLPTAEELDNADQLREHLRHTWHSPSMAEIRNNEEQQEQEEGMNFEGSTMFITAVQTNLTAFNNNEIKTTNQQQVFDSDFEYFPEESDSDISCTEASHKEQGDDEELINVNRREDTVGIEKNADVTKTAKVNVSEALEDKLLKNESTRLRSIRTIPIQNGGNGGYF